MCDKNLFLDCAMKTITLIISLCLTISSSGQVNDENAFFQGTYNKDYIKQHKIKTASAQYCIGTNILAPRIFHFDKNGVLLAENNLDSNGKEVPRFIFKYNQKGDLILRITCAYEGYKVDTDQYVKTYKGDLMIKDSSVQRHVSTTHFYNRQGQEIETSHPYIYGFLWHSRRVVKKEYDRNGRLIHITDRILKENTDTIDQWMSDRTIVYENNRLKKVIEKIQNGEIPTNRGNLEYTYDSLNNLQSIASDVVTSYYFTYADNGLLASKREKYTEGFDTLSDAMAITKYKYTFWK